MADKTGIEWTDATWNVVSGCTRVSEGCERCYIERTPPFRMEGRRFDGPQIGATTGVRLHEDRLALPLKWRAPRRIFVNSLSDLFHGEVPDDLIAKVFAVMALAPRHAFQVLTKRPGRMRSLLTDEDFAESAAFAIVDLVLAGHDGSHLPELLGDWWPLPNVWLGTSVENQHWADVRIPHLLDTPAAVRWISAEPLLGPVTFRWAKWKPLRGGWHLDALRDIDWVVAGGESGLGARPMHPAWARDLRDQCVEAAVPFLFKQHGEYISYANGGRPDGAFRSPWFERAPDAWVSESGAVADEATATAEGGSWHGVWRVGKKAAGRELDGRTWDEFPAVAG